MSEGLQHLAESIFKMYVDMAALNAEIYLLQMDIQAIKQKIQEVDANAPGGLDHLKRLHEKIRRIEVSIAAKEARLKSIAADISFQSERYRKNLEYFFMSGCVEFIPTKVLK